jgi:hypothetical protein
LNRFVVSNCFCGISLGNDDCHFCSAGTFTFFNTDYEFLLVRIFLVGIVLIYSVFLCSFDFFSALDEMKNHLENPKNMIEMKFLLLEQKFLELISKGNRMNALKVNCLEI